MSVERVQHSGPLAIGTTDDLAGTPGHWFLDTSVSPNVLRLETDIGTYASITASTEAVLAGVESMGRVFQTVLPRVASGLLLVADTAYFVYLGRASRSMTPKYVEFYVVTGGTGAQTAEIGLFSTPLPPNKSSQVLTKLVANGTLGDLTTTGVKRNTSALATGIQAGTYLWAGIRTNMATDQPTMFAIFGDFGQGSVLQTATAGVLTGAGPWTGAIPTVATTATTPDLRGTLD